MNFREAIKILDRLESERFHRWYEGKFVDYITGEYEENDPRHISKEMILEDIEYMFRDLK